MPVAAKLPEAATIANRSYTIDSKGQTVLDNLSKLTWQREAPKKEYNWKQAKAYCKTLNFAGAGWHLPTKEELESLVDKSQMPTIDPAAVPDTPEDWFWTATYEPYASYAWSVSFNNGASYDHGITSSNRVRCVRSNSTVQSAQSPTKSPAPVKRKGAAAPSGGRHALEL